MSNPLLLLVVVVVLFLSVRWAECVTCEQRDSSDRSCFFVCRNGFDRNVVSRFERLWLDNRTCNQQDIRLRIDDTILYENNTLNTHWFRSSLPIMLMVIDLRLVVAIQTGAFGTPNFRTLKILHIHHLSGVVHLHAGIFEGLVSLEFLYLKHFKCHQIAAPQWLRNVRTTLQHLNVHGSEQAAYNLNALTSDAALLVLREIRYSLNLNGTLNGRTFRGLNSVETLYLSGCHIEHIDAAVFDTMAGSLRLLDLRNNRLRQLPDGIFDRLLAQPDASEQKRVWLSGNPWDCRCRLAYVQFRLLAHADVFAKEPALCRTPSSVAGEPVATVRFCVNGQDVVFDKVVRCAAEDQTRTDDTTEIAFKQNPFRLRKRVPAAGEETTFDVLHLREGRKWPWLFLRFMAGRDRHFEDAAVNILDCIWGGSMQHRLQMHDDSEKYEYTGNGNGDGETQLMCMLSKSDAPLGTISPLDCTAVFVPPHRRDPRADNNVLPASVWLMHEQKPAVLAVLMLVILGIFALGGLSIVAAIYLGWVQHARTEEQQHQEDSAGHGDEKHYEELDGYETAITLRSTCRDSTAETLVYESTFDVVPPARESKPTV